MLLLLMVMIAAALTAVIFNSSLQQQKKENSALNARINGLTRAIRLEQAAQADLPTVADLEKRLAAEKDGLDSARQRLPTSVNLVNTVGDLIRKAEENYLIAVPLSTDPPAGDLAKSSYLRAGVRLQLSGNYLDVMAFLAGLEKAGVGDYVIDSVTVSLVPPAGPESLPPLNESPITAQINLALNYRPPTVAANEARP